MSNNIYTIGHSNHSIAMFLGLLKPHNIEVIADVRSSPFSRMNPQFNRENLQRSLVDAGIRYVFLGRELGARSDDPDCYVNGKVQYDRLAKAELFKSGIERVIEGQKTLRIALMCAEKEPLDCHRAILLARELDKLGLRVMHIMPDGALESHQAAIDRLTKEFGLSGDDLFQGKEQLVDLAYMKQSEKIAYVRSGIQITNDKHGKTPPAADVLTGGFRD